MQGVQEEVRSPAFASNMVLIVIVLTAAAFAAAASTSCPCPGYCAGPHAALPAGVGPPPGLITVSATPGAANCTTIGGAVALTRFGYRDRYTIEVAPGEYREKVVIGANRPPITLRGMSAAADGVLLRWTDADGAVSPTDHVGEWFDQTLWVGAADFRLENVSVAGCSLAECPKGGRNMALQVAADRASFARSRFYGASADTLYHGSKDHRAYFDACYVNGTYDFIWGAGSAVFEGCELVGSANIFAHKGSQLDTDGRPCERWDLGAHSCTGCLVLGSRVTRPQRFTHNTTTLARAWRGEATVVYRDSWLDSHIARGGWLVGDRTVSYDNVTFAEANTTGPGARRPRVAPGVVLAGAAAAAWTRQAVLRGWDPLRPSQEPFFYA